MNLDYYPDVTDEDDVNETDVLWKDIAIDISKIPTLKFKDVKDLSFQCVKDMVSYDSAEDAHLCAYAELNFFQYKYYKLNNIYPNAYRFEQFRVDRFVSDLFKYYKIPGHAYVKNTYQDDTKCTVSSILIGFSKTLYLYVDGENKGIIFYSKYEESDKSSLLYTLLGLLKNVKPAKVVKNKIYIIYKNQYGFQKVGFNIKKIKVDLDENYNDDFIEVSDKIITGLNDRKKTHLVILSGESGVGKTNYVRYLTSKLKKNIIFVSPDMVESITDPGFIPFLMKNNDSILIIEDAEPALEKRNNGGRSSAVSNVLNLTDGLLSDCLKISIVATFNTKEKNIDEALTRKGRLLMSYKFERLSTQKSVNLLQKLGHSEIEVKEPMTLSDIYYYGTDNISKKDEHKRIGFK
jgi:hypothetical protein